MAIIYLTRSPERPALGGRVRLLPEGFFPLSREKRAGNSSLCFVLHHMGFFVRSRLREDPVGSYPAFSPLPGISTDAGRSIFCDTIPLPGICTPGTLAFTRHVALRCSDFPLARKISRQRSPATFGSVP